MDPGAPIMICGERIEAGRQPIVILGANGSGKSTAGHDLAKRGAQRIAAARRLQIPDQIALQLEDTASTAYRENERKAKKTQDAMNDFAVMMSLLQSKDVTVALALKARIAATGKTEFSKDDKTSPLTVIQDLWGTLFPGRQLIFDGASPQLTSTLGGKSTSYAQSAMSDGERQALYLAAKVVLSREADVLVVDEPEIHLHSALAKRLWDALEGLRPKSRFIYITHDVSFALSRIDATYLLMREPGKVKQIGAPDVPLHAAEHILGAATTSLRTTSIYFCEGKVGSWDRQLYRAWFEQASVDVCAVDGCDSVVTCLRGFNQAQVVVGAKAKGIVDRDERCEEELAFLKGLGIHVLPVAEVEGLFCLPGVVATICRYLNREEGPVLAKILERLRSRLRPILHVHASKFVVDKLRWDLTFPKDAVSPGSSLASVKANVEAALGKAHSAVDIQTLIEESSRALESALVTGIEAILKCFSGKGMLAVAAEAVGTTPELYTQLVFDLLGDKLQRNELHLQLIDSFKEALPPRNGK